MKSNRALFYAILVRANVMFRRNLSSSRQFGVGLAFYLPQQGVIDKPVCQLAGYQTMTPKVPNLLGDQRSTSYLLVQMEKA